MKITNNIEPLLNISVSELKRIIRRFKLIYLKNRYGGTKGFCNICGLETTFLRRGNITFNNSMSCEHCGGIARYRLIALILSNYFTDKNNGVIRFNDFSKNIVKSLYLKRLKKEPGVKILDTSFKSFLYKELNSKYDLMMSEYIPSILPKEKLFGIWHQDLTRINAPDNYFDCIITSEVFEHVYDPWIAFEEIKRVLKPNGLHVFTVPFYKDVDSLVRATMDKGKIINHLEPAYHIDPLSKKGSLVFTDFGRDLIDKLNHRGLKTEYISLTDPKLGFDDTYALISFKV
jgi:SAM-dependent methyltransferase